MLIEKVKIKMTKSQFNFNKDKFWHFYRLITKMIFNNIYI